MVSGLTARGAASDFVLHRCNSAGTLVFNQCDIGVIMLKHFCCTGVPVQVLVQLNCDSANLDPSKPLIENFLTRD